MTERQREGGRGRTKASAKGRDSDRQDSRLLLLCVGCGASITHSRVHGYTESDTQTHTDRRASTGRDIYADTPGDEMRIDARLSPSPRASALYTGCAREIE